MSFLLIVFTSGSRKSNSFLNGPRPQNIRNLCYKSFTLLNPLIVHRLFSYLAFLVSAEMKTFLFISVHKFCLRGESFEFLPRTIKNCLLVLIFGKIRIAEKKIFLRFGSIYFFSSSTQTCNG